MTKYSLSTWMGEQMIEVEASLRRMRGMPSPTRPVVSMSLAQHGGALMRLGVCYRLDRRTEDDGPVGCTQHELLWVPHGAESC